MKDIVNWNCAEDCKYRTQTDTILVLKRIISIEEVLQGARISKEIVQQGIVWVLFWR